MSRIKPNEIKPEGQAAPWLLLIHQLPPQPAYHRVKIWRRLQGLGAVALRNAIYALPQSEQTLEDFQWLLREIEQLGGEGMICEASLIDGMTDQEVRAQFDAARDADYEALATELRAIAAAKPEAKQQLTRLRRRFTEISAIDFFSATGRMTVEALLSALEAEMTDALAADKAASHATADLIGKLWVTRRGVHIDRIACAWAVRRFIDPAARFKFVAVKDYAAQPGEIRFDMFKGEITHAGDKCSFEVLLEQAGIADPALTAIAEIVHDIDLKDGKFGREEAAGIAHVIAGICSAEKDDMARIERGSAVLNDTYEHFRRRKRR